MNKKGKLSRFGQKKTIKSIIFLFFIFCQKIPKQILRKTFSRYFVFIFSCNLLRPATSIYIVENI